MTPLQTLLKDTEEKMKRITSGASRGFGELRGGRASPSLVEQIGVEYYGTTTPLKQLAAITAPDPRSLVIQPWDVNAASAVEKAILKAGVGITPIVEGKVLRLPIPPLTGDRRNELTRLAHKMAEEGRVHIRNVRRDANESIKKLKSQKQISEDEAFKSQDQVQKLTDRNIEQVNTLLKTKEKELQST